MTLTEFNSLENKREWLAEKVESDRDEVNRLVHEKLGKHLCDKPTHPCDEQQAEPDDKCVRCGLEIYKHTTVPDYFTWEHAGPLLDVIRDEYKGCEGTGCCNKLCGLTRLPCTQTPTAIVTAFLLGGEG